MVCLRRVRGLRRLNFTHPRPGTHHIAQAGAGPTSHLRRASLRYNSRPQYGGYQQLEVVFKAQIITQQSPNLLNPSHQIPPEILTSIFSYISHSGGRTKRTGFLATESVDHSKAIVTLTHVCRYWRVTLLSNPTFWTSANLTDPSMTAALLERSDSMPIIAAFMTPNPVTPVPSTEALLPHFSKIRKVHVHAPLKQLMEFLSNFCGHSSILEAVELQHRFSNTQSGGDGRGGGNTEMWRVVFELPPMFRNAPGLKYLRVSELPFSNCFLEFHDLTHLELSWTTTEPYDCIRVISANPMLEVVILRGNKTPGWVPPQTVAVSLPHLRRMELHSFRIRDLVRRVLEWFTFPPGAHLSCVCPEGYSLPSPDGLPNVSTVAKLQFKFSKRRRYLLRLVSGYGPNGTFLLSDDLHQVGLHIRGVPLGSVEELSISFANAGMEGGPSFTLVGTNGYLLGSDLSSFIHLRTITLQRVRGSEIILGILCNPQTCPELNTVVLANVQSHTTYWPSLVEMARSRDQNATSSNLHRVDIVCLSEDSPAPDQLAELRAHVFLVEVKPWDHEVQELAWLNDPRFRNLHRL